MRFSKWWMLAAPAAGLLALAPNLAADSGTKDNPAPGLTVHEWGTFSTFSGSDGKDVKFYPNDDDLPAFVHGYLSRQSKAGPAGGTVSLETPVLYFYTDRPLTASVHVEFPKGTVTEWYPQAKRTDGRPLAGDDPPSTLDWDGIKVLPGEKLTLPTEKNDSRYYAARETDAAPLRVPCLTDDDAKLEDLIRQSHGDAPRHDAVVTDDGKAVEQEKFLFYRGVGDLDMPLKVRAWGDGKFTVDWKGGKPAGVMLLVQVRGGKVRFEPFIPDHATDGLLRAEVRLPDSDCTLDQLGDAMAKVLVTQGLYEKEARAMVKTWRSAWFGEEGTRVLYILPRDATDDFLPTKIDPKPTSYVRVMVGRHDVLTPEREKQIDGWVATLTRPAPDQDAKLKTASEALAGLGRYRDAAWAEAETRLQSGGGK